ncbi:MAG: hypothetical protein PHW95_04130 [Patescibacteria group bacterium]|nr:hypothetical protein [Patescibacteria group bacterium]
MLDKLVLMFYFQGISKLFINFYHMGETLPYNPEEEQGEDTAPTNANEARDYSHDKAAEMAYAEVPARDKIHADRDKIHALESLGLPKPPELEQKHQELMEEAQAAGEAAGKEYETKKAKTAVETMSASEKKVQMREAIDRVLTDAVMRPNYHGIMEKPDSKFDPSWKQDVLRDISDRIAESGLDSRDFRILAPDDEHVYVKYEKGRGEKLRAWEDLPRDEQNRLRVMTEMAAGVIHSESGKNLGEYKKLVGEYPPLEELVPFGGSR